MKSIVLTTALVVVMGSALYLREQPAANAQAKSAPAVWEYKAVYTEYWHTGDPTVSVKKLTEKYNELAADGWEYVGPYQGAGIYSIFKRPKR
jgi:hypothetical protein